MLVKYKFGKEEVRLDVDFDQGGQLKLDFLQHQMSLIVGGKNELFQLMDKSESMVMQKQQLRAIEQAQYDSLKKEQAQRKSG